MGGKYFTMKKKKKKISKEDILKHKKNQLSQKKMIWKITKN